MDLQGLGSIAGITTTTYAIVEGCKTHFADTPYLRHVPLVFIAIFVAMGLTLLAHSAGYLPGPLSELLAKTVLAAIASNGLHSLVTGSSTQPLQQTATPPKADAEKGNA